MVRNLINIRIQSIKHFIIYWFKNKFFTKKWTELFKELKYSNLGSFVFPFISFPNFIYQFNRKGVIPNQKNNGIRASFDQFRMDIFAQKKHFDNLIFLNPLNQSFPRPYSWCSVVYFLDHFFYLSDTFDSFLKIRRFDKFNW